MANVFVSHASKDKPFVRKLCRDLQILGHKVWLDEWQISLGDSIISKLQEGIEQAEFLLLVLSKNAVEADWVAAEWRAKYWDEINEKRIRILTILRDDCKIPTFLRDKRYADFRSPNRYALSLAQISQRLHSVQSRSGLRKFYSDFVDIDCWETLFENSKHVDLLFMYSETWRNTNLKLIKKLLSSGGRIRVILPNVPQKSALVRVYSDKFDIEDLRAKVRSTAKAFLALGKRGQVQVYASKRYFTHAMYIFEGCGILALYSYGRGRTPTPAFLIENGDLLSFLKSDFEWLVSKDGLTHRIKRASKNRPSWPRYSKPASVP